MNLEAAADDEVPDTDQPDLQQAAEDLTTVGPIAQEGPGERLQRRPVFSVVIPTHSRRDLLERLLQRLRLLPGPAREVIVVDDASSDGTSELLREQFPEVRVVRNDEARGFDALPDAMALARGKYVMQLDDDAWPAEGTLDRVVEHFEERGPQLGLVALPFVEAKSGRRGYTPYLPAVEPAKRYGPTSGFYQGAVVFRREAAQQIPPSPPGYFMYQTEPVTVIEYLASGWEADYLPDAPIVHLWHARGQKVSVRNAVIMLRNDLVTIRRYYSGWRRLDLMVGRYLTGAVHLLFSGAPLAFGAALREADEMLRANSQRRVNDSILERVLPCFDGLSLSTFFGETNRRRAAWFFGLLPDDQAP